MKIKNDLPMLKEFIPKMNVKKPLYSETRISIKKKLTIKIYPYAL